MDKYGEVMAEIIWVRATLNQADPGLKLGGEVVHQPINVLIILAASLYHACAVSSWDPG